MRGKRPELVEPAVRSALRETVFRFELVMRINVVTHDLVDREGLINAALSAQVALVTSQERREPKDIGWLGQLRDLLVSRVSELRAAQEARALVQVRYLDGHPALFPDVAAAWDEQVKSTEIIADMAVRLAEFDDVPPAAPPDPTVVSDRTTELRQAFDIAAGWVRGRLNRVLGQAGGP